MDFNDALIQISLTIQSVIAIFVSVHDFLPFEVCVRYSNVIHIAKKARLVLCFC